MDSGFTSSRVKSHGCTFTFMPGMARLNFGWNPKSNWRRISVSRLETFVLFKLSSRHMPMKSAPLGTDTLEVEVTNISKHGFWLLLRDRELFLPFSEFPWFKEATIAQLIAVEWPSPHHLYWPDLDIDLAVESIEHPGRFPLVSRLMPNKPSQPTAPDGALETD